MNENNITVMAVPATDEDETELDLLDLLATMLLKWKQILAWFLICAILGCGYATMKNSRSNTEPVTLRKALESTREQLTEDKALAVERLFLQYLSYQDLQRDLSTYYSTFTASDVNLYSTAQMRAQYYITSSIKDLDTVFIKMAVTETDYQAMREIAPDEEVGATIYDRISFTTAYNENKDNNVKVSVQEEGENAYLINVELYGNSEEQCRKMMAVVDKAFRREAEELKVLDPGIKLENLGEQINYDVTDYMLDLRKKNLDRMTAADNELNNLNNKVTKLSAEEKAYYELLMQEYDDSYTAEMSHHTSRKKWTVIGAFCGTLIGVGIVFLGYVLNGKVQSACELEQSGKLLNRVFIKGKKNLFGRWAAGLIHADDTDPTVKADMVATDVGILMDKSGKNTLMLLCNQNDADAAAFAEQVKARLLAKNGNLKVNVGNPLQSVDELEMAAQADMGVAFAEIKKSKRAMLHEWKQICERYKLPLAGTVAVQRMW